MDAARGLPGLGAEILATSLFPTVSWEGSLLGKGRICTPLYILKAWFPEIPELERLQPVQSYS